MLYVDYKLNQRVGYSMAAVCYVAFESPEVGT